MQELENTTKYFFFFPLRYPVVIFDGGECDHADQTAAKWKAVI